MNTTEKIKKMKFWMKVFIVVGLVMIVVALSTLVWGERDEDGGLVGLGAGVGVASIVVMGLMILGVYSIIFMGLSLCAQHSSENDR